MAVYAKAGTSPHRRAVPGRDRSPLWPDNTAKPDVKNRRLRSIRSLQSIVSQPHHSALIRHARVRAKTNVDRQHTVGCAGCAGCAMDFNS